MSATKKSRSAKRDADRWFREQGLPTFVPLRRAGSPTCHAGWRR
ncbi:hypothetical protein [Microbacterium sp. W4I20]|nr:hypothetical protein [Microbacterium sp. W4I20]MDQ0727696.1 hypothetical protein [Microbacterium sp. W4I20]